ncbi:UNVERIFIED_CONTAM: hypothetical protein NCL1_31150 [Trichonephila clavipes]
MPISSTKQLDQATRNQRDTEGGICNAILLTLLSMHKTEASDKTETDWLPLASFHIHQSPPPARHRARGRAFHQGQGHFPTFHEMVLNNEGNSREDQQPTLSVFAVKLSLEGY